MSDAELELHDALESVASAATKDLSVLVQDDVYALFAEAFRRESLLETRAAEGHLKVAALLLRRFQDTLQSSGLDALQPLLAAVTGRLLPALQKLEGLLAARTAFQSASILAPWPPRCVVLAAQCCALAVREVPAESVSTLAFLATCVAEVLESAVLLRAETHRPFDAIALAKLNRGFVSQQAALKQLFLRDGAPAEEAMPQLRALEPLRRESHLPITWKIAELGDFWALHCRPKYGHAVPVEVLPELLLTFVACEDSPEHREVLAQRLRRLCCGSETKPLHVTGVELDTLAAEVRRAGSLRAWIAVLLAGGSEGGSDFGTATAAASGRRALSARLPSPKTGMDLSHCKTGFGSTWGSSMTPSTRPATTSSFSARSDRIKPYAISSSLGRKANFNGNSALHMSLERNNLIAAQHLVLGNKVHLGSLDRTAAFHETPLHTAAFHDVGRHAPFTSLLLRGAEGDIEALNRGDRHDSTPLHVAAAAGKAEVASRLLQAGAEVNRTDRWSSTPLHRAAKNGQKEMVDLLLQSGAAKDCSDNWGSKPLHGAASRGEVIAAERLLKAGADVNSEDIRGDRAIHVAARSGDFAMVKVLLEYGAEPRACDGRSAADEARARGHDQVVALLEHRQDWIIPRVKSLAVRA